MFIIDVQGFNFPKENVFLCREIAIYNVEMEDYVHKFVTLPITKEMLNLNFITFKNQCELDWTSWDDQEEIKYEEISKFLYNYVMDESILVKNKDVKTFLEKFLHNNIISLEDEYYDANYLSDEEMKKIFRSHQCSNHYNCDKATCALENVFNMYFWYKFCKK